MDALKEESGIWLFCIPSGATQVGGFRVVNPATGVMRLIRLRYRPLLYPILNDLLFLQSALVIYDHLSDFVRVDER